MSKISIGKFSISKPLLFSSIGIVLLLGGVIIARPEILRGNFDTDYLLFRESEEKGEETSVESTEDVFTDEDEFYQSLANSRWIGEMNVATVVGNEEGNTYNSYVANLDFTFLPTERAYTLDIIGNVSIQFGEPRFERLTPLGPDDMGTIELVINLERYFSISDVEGMFFALNRPFRYQQPARLGLSESSLKQLRVGGNYTMHVRTAELFPTGPKVDVSETQTFTTDSCIGHIGTMCDFRHLGGSNIEVTIDGRDRLILESSWESGGELTSGIPDTAVGFLERVQIEEREEALKEGDSLETDSKTSVIARLAAFTDPNSEVYIGPNTPVHMTADEALEFLRGEVRMKLLESDIPFTFEVQNPQAVTAVRGTDFMMRILDEETTIVVVYEGEVEVTSRDTGNSVIVGEGQYTIIERDTDPVEPIDIFN